jgi:ferredoxin
MLRKIFSPSTHSFIDEAKETRNYRWFDLLHGYVYARWPYLYIGIGKGEHKHSPAVRKIGALISFLQRLFIERKNDVPGSSFANGYHGKVVPLSAATQLVMVNEPIRIENLEKIIPYNRAKDIILKNPTHIIALDCPCRVVHENPCLPLDVCLIVGEPFASFVHEHHSARSRWISPDEAVTILEAEDARGHVHHAFFKDAMLDRFYAICNCCACCCGAMNAHQRGTPMLASSGHLSCADLSLCIGCGDCVDFCQFSALSLREGYIHIDESACMGCGICLSKCPQSDLSLRIEPTKGVPLEVRNLIYENQPVQNY